jgi:signal peptidase I
MYPTIHDKDFILVDKISHRFTDYQRGDIIVFVPPGKTDPYVKRIIGLSGETVTIKDNTVKICKTDTDECQMLDQ